MNHPLPQARSPLAPLLVCTILAALLTGRPARAEDADPAVAVVNDRTIRRSALYAGIPDALKKKRLRLRLQLSLKLERLIDLSLQSQFVDEAKIVVTDKEMDAVIAAHREKATISACACGCSGFKSLGEYLRTKMMAPEEYRETIRVSIALKKHIDDRWKARFEEKGSLARALKERRSKLEALYVRTAGIFFRKDSTDPKLAGADPLKRGAAAWQRLAKGEDFGALARALSEDKATAPRGGDLGLQERGKLVGNIRSALSHLAVGAYTRPLPTWNGCVILKRLALDQADLVEIMKAEFEKEEQLALLVRLRKDARIRKLKR